MEKSREQFEDYCRTVDLPLEIFNGNYNWNSTRLAWEGWQASRESLVVELPKKYLGEYTRNKTINECKDILISNGVKIKNE